MSEAEAAIAAAKADRTARQIHYIVWPTVAMLIAHGLAWRFSHAYRAVPPFAPLALGTVAVVSGSIIGWQADTRTLKALRAYYEEQALLDAGTEAGEGFSA